MDGFEIIFDIQSMDYSFGVDLQASQYHVAQSGDQSEWYLVDFAKDYLKKEVLGRAASIPKRIPLMKVRMVTYLTVFLRDC